MKDQDGKRPAGDERQKSMDRILDRLEALVLSQADQVDALRRRVDVLERKAKYPIARGGN